MGLRDRKSFTPLPDVWMTMSDSGDGYRTPLRGRHVAGDPEPRPGRRQLSATIDASRRASRYAARLVPTPRRVTIERTLVLIGFVMTIVGMVAAPLLLLAVPVLLVALIMSLVNLKADLRWARDRRAARVLAPGDPRVTGAVSWRGRPPG